MLSVQGLTDSEIPTNYDASTSAKSNAMDASPLLIKDTVSPPTVTESSPPIKTTTSLKTDSLKSIPFTVMTNNNANMTQSEMLSLTLSTNTTTKIRSINVRGSESQENIPTSIEPAFKRQRHMLKDDLQPQQTISVPVSELTSTIPFIENDELEPADITAETEECM